MVVNIFILVLQVPCQKVFRYLQKPLQDHLQKGLEHKGVRFIIIKKEPASFERLTSKGGGLGPEKKKAPGRVLSNIANFGKAGLQSTFGCGGVREGMESYWTVGPTRWAPSSYKSGCSPYKWLYKYATGVITRGPIAPFITIVGAHLVFFLSQKDGGEISPSLYPDTECMMLPTLNHMKLPKCLGKL